MVRNYSEDLRYFLKTTESRYNGVISLETLTFTIITYYNYLVESNNDCKSAKEIIEKLNEYDNECIDVSSINETFLTRIKEIGNDKVLDLLSELISLRPPTSENTSLVDGYEMTPSAEVFFDYLFNTIEKVKKDVNDSIDMSKFNIPIKLKELVDTDLVLVELLGEGSCGSEKTKIKSILNRYGINYKNVALEGAFNILNEILNKITSDNNNDNFEESRPMDDIHAKKVDPKSNTPALDEFATDITKEAAEGKYDPVIGREKECQEIIEILCCRKKNNVMITGVPGGGKSTIVEKLAQKIASGDVPKKMKNKKIYSLDLNALLAGCSLRGQYEERLQNVIKEVCNSEDIIVYIDEAHNLVGNGSSRESGDGANILKPYLAKGLFHMIGSTTDDEYRTIIEKDGALKRRFTQVRLAETTVEECYEIINGIAPKYSEFHKVTYTPEALKACVDWSGKYINGQHFPDKAISVLDMASSVAMLDEANSQRLTKLETKIDGVKNKAVKKIASIKPNSNEEQVTAVFDEVRSLWNEVDELTEKVGSVMPKVTVDHVANVISKISNVPLDKIRSTDIDKIKAMKDALAKRVIGQDEAVEQVTMALQRNILGLRDQKKPIASFLLTGCSGTGKSYITKILAEEYFGSIDSLEMIAGSEYSQEWAESKLLGSAPGYVNSDQEPRLYVLKKKPYCVIGVEEIEKFSPKLYNVWLNMLEEGEVTLSSGEKISCRNCIFVFTSNCGTKTIEAKGSGIGYGNKSSKDFKKLDEEVVMSEVRKEFRPEFLNRLTKIIVFNRLSKEDLDKIFWLELQKLQDRLKESGFILNVSEAVKDLAVSKCDSKYGARSLIRNITKYVEEEVCKAMLNQNIKGKNKIFVDTKENEEIIVTFKK